MHASKALLERLLKSQRVPHALVFAGPKGVGKADTAKAFAHELMGGSFPSDLHLLGPDYPIESIRALIEEAALPPYAARAKVFLLDEAEQISLQSGNALLKTIEEPLPGSYFILITSRPEALLPTLLSRCQTISFFPTQPLEHTAQSKYAFLFQDKPLLEQLDWCQKNELATEEMDLIFHDVLNAYRKTPDFERVFRLVNEVRYALEHHVKPRTCLEYLFLTIP